VEKVEHLEERTETKMKLKAAEGFYKNYI